MFLGENLVTLRTKKHNVVARSSAKVKFWTTAHEVCELLWLWIILYDLKMVCQELMVLCDKGK